MSLTFISNTSFHSECYMLYEQNEFGLSYCIQGYIFVPVLYSTLLLSLSGGEFKIWTNSKQ